MGVVVRASVRSVAERIEHNPPRLRFGPNQIEHRLHRRPSHFATPDHPWMQKCWVICSWYGSARTCSIVSSTGFATRPWTRSRYSAKPESKSCRYSSDRGYAPLCQKYGEMSCSEYSPGFVSTCSNSRWTGPISAKPSRCTDLGRRSVTGVAATQATATITIDAANTTKPTHEPESRAA